MGINFSQVLSGESGITSDCKMNGYDYQVKGTYFSMSCFLLIIYSEALNLRSATFRKNITIQKSSEE